jgi:hypothetical protein
VRILFVHAGGSSLVTKLRGVQTANSTFAGLPSGQGGLTKSGSGILTTCNHGAGCAAWRRRRVNGATT